MDIPVSSFPDGYKVPEIWEVPTNAVCMSNEALFCSNAEMNRPTAGARSVEELPRGKHNLQLYSMGTPNGMKVKYNYIIFRKSHIISIKGIHT